MANSEQLRSNPNQHKAKNTLSKNDDKIIYQAMINVKQYLEKRFATELSQKNLFIEHRKTLTLKEVIEKINESKLRNIPLIDK